MTDMYRQGNTHRQDYVEVYISNLTNLGIGLWLLHPLISDCHCQSYCEPTGDVVDLVARTINCGYGETACGYKDNGLTTLLIVMVMKEVVTAVNPEGKHYKSNCTSSCCD